jgi:hypothetical protein
VIVICISYLVAGGTSLYEGQKISRDDEPAKLFPPLIDPPVELGLDHESINVFNTEADDSDESSSPE